MRFREHGICLALALVFGLVLVGLAPARLDLLELGLFDLRMSLLERPADPRIRVIGLEEGLGGGGWDGPTARRLLVLLQRGGTQGVYLMDPPSQGWSALGSSLAGFAEAAVRVRGEARGIPPEVLATDSRYEPEPDGAVRRVCLAAPGGAGPLQPGPALVMVAALEGVPASSIEFGPGSVRVGRRLFATDPEHRIWIHFQERARAAGELSTSPLHPISAGRFLEKPDAPVLRRLQGTVALVGNFSNEARDEVMTAGGTLRALQVESAVLDTLLSGRLLHRPGRGGQAVITLLLGLALGFCLPLMRLRSQVLLVLGVSLGYLALNLAAFANGLWLDLVAPLAEGALVFLTALSLLFIRSTRLFGQFLAPDLARDVLHGSGGASLGGREKVCTVMFFSLPPCFKKGTWEPATLLIRRNQFTSRAASIVEKWGGRVMDFQGDAQMVLFGAPQELPEHALAATAAALEILEAARTQVALWGLEDPALAAVHAGVCTGPLAVGFVGSEQHKEFAALGDTTNVAARLYAAAVKMGVPVLVSGSAMASAGGAIQATPLPPLPLKGKTEPVPVFQVVGVRGGATSP